MSNNKNELMQDLKRKIISMDLRPAEQLDEVQLGRTYGLSRTPVREALLQLAGEGFVEIRENKGARVARMDHITVKNFFIAAPLIYTAVGRLAAINFKPSQLADLRATQARFQAAVNASDWMAQVVENSRFHEIIGEMSGNDYLQASLRRLLIDHARIGDTFFRPHDAQTTEQVQLSATQHDMLIESIAAGDADAVEDMAKKHFDLCRANIHSFIWPEEDASQLALTGTYDHSNAST